MIFSYFMKFVSQEEVDVLKYDNKFIKLWCQMWRMVGLWMRTAPAQSRKAFIITIQGDLL